MKQNLQTIKKVKDLIRLSNNFTESGKKFRKSFNLTCDYGAQVIKNPNRTWQDILLLGLVGSGTILRGLKAADDTNKLIKAT
jgi:hypothetical protein